LLDHTTSEPEVMRATRESGVIGSVQALADAGTVNTNVAVLRCACTESATSIRIPTEAGSHVPCGAASEVVRALDVGLAFFGGGRW
jgi:hypothetical protein